MQKVPIYKYADGRIVEMVRTGVCNCFRQGIKDREKASFRTTGVLTKKILLLDGKTESGETEVSSTVWGGPPLVYRVGEKTRAKNCFGKELRLMDQDERGFGIYYHNTIEACYSHVLNLLKTGKDRLHEFDVGFLSCRPTRSGFWILEGTVPFWNHDGSLGKLLNVKHSVN